MPVMTEVASYIVSTSTRYKVGGSTGSKVPLWQSSFPPDQANTAVALFESGGSGGLYAHGGNLVLERPTFQVIARSTSYATARDHAEHIYSLLTSVTNATLSKTTSTGTTSYLTITAVQSPTDMGQDAEERKLITCNFITEKAPS